MLRALSLLLVVQLCVAQQLEWPKQYTAKGHIILPYGEIVEPFTAYVDMSGKGRSRIDYYGGSAIDLNLGDQGQHGTIFKIAYETTQEFANVMTCFGVPGVVGAPVTPQGVLPDISMYKYATDLMYNGVMSEVYMSSNTEEEKNNNYTLIVRKDSKNPITLRFVGFDRLFNSYYDEYVIEYSDFETTLDATVFDYASKFTCKGFPGPGVTLPMIENPMFEFVGASGYEEKHRSYKVDSDFEEFKGHHSRKYESEGEEVKRKTHFRHNHRYIHSMNRRDLPYKLGVNHLTDLADGEISRMRGYRHTPNSPRGTLYKPSISDVPQNYNWRLRGAVTPVKEQGLCGSCWSFGTTGTLEGSQFIKNGMKNLKAFSEQSLIDCSWGYGNNGCNGGESERAYKWIIENGCIPTEESYGGGKFLMQDGFCKVNESECGARISMYVNTAPGNETSLMMAIAERGPISVAIDASHKSFNFYSHGVYYEPACGNGVDNLDHQVLAVGYGTLTPGDPDSDYWYIKNSWSTHWGNDGYVLMSRKNNNCGVTTDASFAILN
ncbi:digestive cysteine proteinase 1-like [Halichondria panicea]|uniref:digestive cysteine proteinase 1-like n=1 Tax=Halichondria panicea TaxID=6063 RepID=UPI00312B959D